MSQASGSGPRATRAANSGPQAVLSNPTPPRRCPSPPQFSLQREPDDASAGSSNAWDVKPDDPLYKAVISCVMVALALIRSDKGKHRLPYTGEDVFKYVREPNRRTCTRSSDLPSWVDNFVAQLSKDFVRVVLTSRTNPKAANGSDMWFERNDWKTWTPYNSGTMFLNKFAIEAMAKARQGTSDHHKKAYDTFAFAIGLEIARGLVLCFAGSLMPFNVDIPTSRGRDLDEAWEDRVFCGEIQNVMDPKDELDIYQAGTVWFINGMAQQIMVPPGLGTQYPEKFKLPLVTRGESILPNQFWETHDAMCDLRAGLRDRAKAGKSEKLLMPPRQQQGPGPARVVATTSTNTTPVKPPTQKAQATNTKAMATATTKTTTTATATANANATAQRRTVANTTGNGAGNGAGRGAGKANGTGTGNVTR